MRIDSSGNLIVGGTAALGGAKLSIDHSGAAIIGADTSSAGGGYIQLLASDTSKGLLGFGSNAGASSINNVALRSQSGDIEFHTNGATERMRIQSNGNISIGGTASGGTPNLQFYHNDSLRAYIRATSAAGMLIDSDSAITFNTNNTARWIIGSGGHITPNNQHAYDIGGVNAEVRNIYAQQLLIGKSSASVNLGGLYVSNNDFMAYTNTSTDSGDRCLVLNRQNGTGHIVDFKQANNVVGKITVTGSATNYSESSDYRLKENVDYTFNALDRVAST